MHIFSEIACDPITALRKITGILSSAPVSGKVPSSIQPELLAKRLAKLQQGMMIIGRRTNFPFSDYVEHLDHENRCDLSYDFLNMAKDGMTMLPHAIDYFIFTPGAFDWTTFPDFVVGNVAYDQAMPSIALKAGLTVVECAPPNDLPTFAICTM